MINRSFITTMVISTIVAFPLLAQEQNLTSLGSTDVVEVNETVRKSKDAVTFVPPTVNEGKILEGKKVTTTDLNALPQITNNNLRQIFSQTSGLLVSEVNNESIASISYRGIGDPHESFNVLLLKDGLPIAADPYGYPANYYLPPVDTLDSVEFYRGGAGLLFGPQPGGAVNFISRKAPLNSEVKLTTRHTLGSNDLYNTYNELSGGDDKAGALGFFHHRQGDGFRTFNSGFDVKNGGFRFTLLPSTETRIFVDLDAYQGRFQEAGGLSNVPGEGENADSVAFIGDDRPGKGRFQSTLQYDNLRIDRYAPTVTLEHDFDKSTLLRASVFGGHYSRASYRQGAGTAPSFGGFANSENNTIQRQVFNTYGGDARLIKEWGGEHTASIGTTLYGSDSPFVQWKGETPFATSGNKEKDIKRQTFVASVFAENNFKFGDFSLVPGVRLENIYQNVDERFNASEGAVLRDESRTDTVPLFGLGSSYQLTKNYQAYANVSQGYKPAAFQDVVPLQSGDEISNDLDPAESITYEIGARGNLASFITVDTSYFYTNFRDQFGRVGSVIQNVGKARYQGVDLAADVNLTKLVDDLYNTGYQASVGSLSWYSNATLLDAEFTGGPLEGKTPQYAPDYLVRTGLIYSLDNKFKVAFLGNFVDSSFADDGNSDNRLMSKYTVWDLTAELPVYKQVSLVAGINNIFDEEYSSRIRSNGIEPGNPRNYYAGLSVNF